MAEIILLRHGQASFGADNYDQLSEVGGCQAYWLGQHMKQLGRHCDRIIMGSMARHRQTVEEVLRGLAAEVETEVHQGLNEYDFQGLLAPLRSRYASQWTATGNARRDYYHNMKCALDYWMCGDIEDDGSHTWAAFRQRIGEAFELACNGLARRTLVVTSGGPIAVILGQVLQLAPKQIRALSLQIKNSSVTTLLYNRVDITLDSFNDVSHLLLPNRQQHITFS